ncbi:MAG: Aminopeptidase [Nitrosopumilales archaeon]|nr:MAG: Aminopeptidase [Nitrosopumilales archaeon]
MKTIFPINYDIAFEPDLSHSRFRGTETVLLKITKPSSTIVLNCAEISIKSCHLIWKTKVLKVKTRLDKKTEKLTIKISKKVRGTAKLFIDFEGILNDRLLGFYKSEYADNIGRKKYLATTQFEAADARKAFPCWDEPEAKATFDVSLIVENKFTALSNMPIKSKKKIGQKTIYKFERTPIMSTYLLYLGVGEFEFLTSKVGSILIRVVTTKGKKKQGKLALELTKKFLNFYQKYFGIKYPLPKLDVIAVPDFAAGAMENWGAITFRETILLYDPKTSSTQTKQRIAEVIAHELTHQWFGNLVTMKWWNDLWLNESFATFMATKAVAKLYPEWDFWDQFLKTSMNEAMNLDALKTSHPIDVKVKNPDEVREIFDSISYEKGGCTLRMLEDFLGEANFRKGLRSYLTKHKYANATTQDLWNSLSRVSKKPVKKMMNTWIKQVGYPLVEAKLKNSRIYLSQNRFLIEDAKKFEKGTWSIPISIICPTESISRLMTKKSDSISIRKDNDWFKINFARKGFYRVKYDEASLENFSALIEGKKLSNIDRWSIENDLFALCLTGKVTLRNYLNFVESYFEDDDYLVSSDLASRLYFIYFMLSRESYSDEIKDYVRRYFERIFDRLGWEPKKNEKHTLTLFRSFAITALGKLGDDKIIAEAKLRFNQHLKNPNSLNPDLRLAVYSLVAWSGSAKMHSKMMQLYKRASMQEEKIRFLTALSNFQNEKLLLKTLEFSLSNKVRSQNLFVPLNSIASNPCGKNIVWPWMKRNWKKLTKKFGIGNPLAIRIIGSLSTVDVKKEGEIRKFFKKNPLPGTERKLEQTLEKVRINSRFVERVSEEFGI